MQLPEHTGLAIRQLETARIDAHRPAGIGIVEEGRATSRAGSGSVERDGGELARVATLGDALAEDCKHRRRGLSTTSNPSTRQECPE